MTIAVRRHFKFTVKDEYGNAISNAQVFVYQPGTTTVFSGTAYTTLSGGTTTTNPFTTNSQGEIEAWFDTPQAVDVLVTDNSDTAVRAGSSSTISFTSFTEFGEIGTGIEAGTGSVSSILVGDTVSAGTSALAAAIDHEHPFPFATGRTTQFTPVADLNDQSFYSHSIAANKLIAGAQFRFGVNLYWTNAATVSGLIFKVRLNTTSGNIVVLGPTFTSTATTHTDTPVDIEGQITVRSIGGSGTILGSCWGQETISTTGATKTPFSSAIITPVTIDTTATNTLELIGDIQTSNTGIQYKVDHAWVQRIN